jgi:4-hydroxy-2-oxoheptanedioate aldolase
VRARWFLTIFAMPMLGSVATAQAATRLNPLVDLLEQRKPIFGLYAPSNRRPGGGARSGGNTVAMSAQAQPEPPKSADQLAREALAYRRADFIFDGSMEGDFDRAFPVFADFAKAMFDGGALQKAPEARLTHPLVVKTHEIAENRALAGDRISRQLKLGVSAIVFVEAESADEVKQGLAMMRFKENGGTRSNDVGAAAKRWGMSESEYRARADVWPLNPRGELVNFTIVESKEGLAHVREIAAVKGIGVLFPGAGTLRGVFTTTDSTGQRVFDEKGWEGAIQQVLAACKEFDVPCGYPATANDIEMRMRQGFSVFVIGWGEAGFKALEIGRSVAGRAAGDVDPQ